MSNQPPNVKIKYIIYLFLLFPSFLHIANVFINRNSPVFTIVSGTTYPSLTPLDGLGVGHGMVLSDIQLTIDGTKFNSSDGYTHLALKVEPPAGSATTETIMMNNYYIMPVSVIASSK